MKAQIKNIRLVASPTEQILAVAANSDLYWNLSDGEKLIWMIDQAYALGCADTARAANNINLPKRKPRKRVRKTVQ